MLAFPKAMGDGVQATLVGTVDATGRERHGRRGLAARASRAALAVLLPLSFAIPLLAQQAPTTPAPPATTKATPAKKKPKDPFTAAQRRELEKIVEEARKALAKEREEVEAALAKLREEREALDREKAEVEAKRAAVEEQAAKVEALAMELETQKIRLDEISQSIPTLVQPSQELAERLAKLEETSQKKPELPPEIVSAGDFPGSIRIPGSPAAIKFGGSVWVSAVSTQDALGSDDRFLTYTIPVTGDPGAEKGPRTSFWANPSKLNFDVRTKAPNGRTIRAFIEGDFAGASNGFRLRHAYVQAGRFLAGQTWSTFSDPDADHGDIDFEGVNPENVQRQAQFRYTRRVLPSLLVAAAIEYPNASLTDTDGKTVRAVNQVPDVVVRGTWTPSAGTRLQGSAVLRNIRGESATRPNDIQKATGWGLSASGTIAQLPWAPRDVVTFQVNGGEGIARFINDLNSAEGQDGAFDPTSGKLNLLHHWGWYVAYLHRWRGEEGEPGELRSSAVWGVVHVDNLEFQPASAYRTTNRFSANLVWTPARNSDVGVQYIWGERTNRNGASGQARQFQLRARYAF